MQPSSRREGEPLAAGASACGQDGCDPQQVDSDPLPEEDCEPSSRLSDLLPPARGRAQTEPLAALVALLAVCTGVALYAGVAQDAAPTVEPAAAAPAMERLSTVAVEDGTVAPAAVPEPEAIVAGGREARITLAYGDRVRTYGPEPPRNAARSARPVSVRVRPGVRRPGRLVVEVWS